VVVTNTNNSVTGNKTATTTSNIATITVSAAVVVVPSAPSITNITLTTNEAGLRITWSSVSGASTYQIYKASSKYGNYSPLTSTNNTIYDDTAVNLNTAGNGYYYQITALNSAGSESSRSAARGVTLPNNVLVCFYTPGRKLISREPPTGTAVRYYNFDYYTGYYVTIGTIEYYATYSRSTAAYTSKDFEISPGTYNLSTKYRYQRVRIFATTSDESVTSTATTSYVTRPSLTLKPVYKYQIDATTGAVTQQTALVVD
jgi:hypothetical protein